MIRTIASRLKIDPNIIIPILAAATGNFKILGEFYSFLSDKLDIESQNSVRYML